MAILFNKVERVLPRTPLVKKWYASLKRISQVKEKQVAISIAEETTLNRKEAEMALAQLEKVLIRELLASNSVQLGDWGSFNLTCNSMAHDTREEVSAASIRRLNVRFMPGKNLKAALQNAQFVAADSLSGKSWHGNRDVLTSFHRSLDIESAMSWHGFVEVLTQIK